MLGANEVNSLHIPAVSFHETMPSWASNTSSASAWTLDPPGNHPGNTLHFDTGYVVKSIRFDSFGPSVVNRVKASPVLAGCTRRLGDFGGLRGDARHVSDESKPSL